MPNFPRATPLSTVRAALRDKGISREQGTQRFVASVRQRLEIEGCRVGDEMVRAAMAQQK